MCVQILIGLIFHRYPASVQDRLACAILKPTLKTGPAKIGPGEFFLGVVEQLHRMRDCGILDALRKHARL